MSVGVVLLEMLGYGTDERVGNMFLLRPLVGLDLEHIVISSGIFVRMLHLFAHAQQ